MSRIAVIGKSGQLARALGAANSGGIRFLGRPELDLMNPGAAQAALTTSDADWVINASAYTAVDKAESDTAAAFRLNRDAVAELAQACKDSGKRFIHVSTDFVFDGKHALPLTPEHPCTPLGVYGQSKREGEQALIEANPDAAIVRTAWVYSEYGSNFLLTMLRLMRSRESISVVSDQIGTPTSAHSLAEALMAMGQLPEFSGIWHYSDCGAASWYDFAVAIAEEAHAAGLLPKVPDITPIPASDYPTPAQRPAYSVLDSRKLRQACNLAPTHWRANLRQVLARLAKEIPPQ